MLGFLQQPYVFALAIVALTATLLYIYEKVTYKDAAQPNKTFFKTLTVGAMVGLGLTYLTSARPEPVATEPFDVPAVGSSGGL